MPGLPDVGDEMGDKMASRWKSSSSSLEKTGLAVESMEIEVAGDLLIVGESLFFA